MKVCNISNFRATNRHEIAACSLGACVASVSVRFRSKERGTIVKMAQAKEWGARFIFRAAKAQNLVPRVVPRFFLAPKPKGNACEAG